jgi:hypothetical protein
MLPPLHVSRLVGALLVVLCFVAGYLLAGWWSGARDTTPLAQICARVDYVDGLQQESRRTASRKRTSARRVQGASRAMSRSIEKAR